MIISRPSMSTNAVAISVKSFAGDLAHFSPQHIKQSNRDGTEQHAHDRRLEGLRDVLLEDHFRKQVVSR